MHVLAPNSLSYVLKQCMTHALLKGIEYAECGGLSANSDGQTLSCFH